MIEQDLYTFIAATLTEVSNRVYPLEAPEKAQTPLAIYNTISVDTIHTLKGASTFHRTGIQVDVYAATYAEAKTLARKLRKALPSWSAVKAIVLEDAIDLIEDTVTPNLYRVSQRMVVQHID